MFVSGILYRLVVVLTIPAAATHCKQRAISSCCLQLFVVKNTFTHCFIFYGAKINQYFSHFQLF